MKFMFPIIHVLLFTSNIHTKCFLIYSCDFNTYTMMFVDRLMEKRLLESNADEITDDIMLHFERDEEEFVTREIEMDDS